VEVDDPTLVSGFIPSPTLTNKIFHEKEKSCKEERKEDHQKVFQEKR
jgi:hypothetical protein